MNHRFFKTYICTIFSLISISYSIHAERKTDQELDKRILLKEIKGTIYESLEIITEKTGYYFIYDSDIINNEEKVKINKGEYSIKEAIYLIIKNDKLELIKIGNHIVIQHPIIQKENTSILIDKSDSLNYISIEGSIFDQSTNEPIPYSSIGILNTSMGTISNQNGYFRLQIPSIYSDSKIYFSHVGYESKDFDIPLLSKTPKRFTLEQKVTSIQEVIIRLNDPKKLIQSMLDKKTLNYSEKPVVFTSFYREGIELKKDFINFTEAVFNIYKAPINSSSYQDQVKLLKMRKIINEEVKDTIIAKIKSGINACLMLDIAKNTPDFFQLDENLYNYAHTDIKIIDNRMVNVISFEQKNNIKTPLYCGEIFLDTDNDALVMAKFEINTKYISKASNMFVEKKSKFYEMTPKLVTYTISYKPFNNTYYINHIRGDLQFKVKKKKQLFGSFQLHTWFEMTTCDIDTLSTKKFSRNEVIPTRNVFSDTNYTYDHNFWENFNVILPEERLKTTINKLLPRIEASDYQ